MSSSASANNNSFWFGKLIGNGYLLFSWSILSAIAFMDVGECIPGDGERSDQDRVVDNWK